MSEANGNAKQVSVLCPECIAGDCGRMVRVERDRSGIKPHYTNFAGEPWANTSPHEWRDVYLWVCDTCGTWADGSDLVHVYGLPNRWLINGEPEGYGGLL